MNNIIPILLQSENIINVYDNQFNESVEYSIETGYRIRNAGAIWKFRYSGTYLSIKVNPTAYATYPQFSHLVIMINGEYYIYSQFTNTTAKVFTLPRGAKEIEIIEGIISKPTTIIGTFITEIILDENKFSKLNQATVLEKTIFLGDSITVGANATIPTYQGFPFLFRHEDNRNVAVLGYGYAKIKDFGETALKINQTTGYIGQLLANVSTTKKIVIALGTNDFAIDGTSAATIKTWYGNLLDAIHLKDSSIEIFCLSPLIRSSDGALLDAYRTAIDELCTDRPTYCTHIVGKTILITGDLSDGVHPTTAGHEKIYDALKLTI